MRDSLANALREGVLIDLEICGWTGQIQLDAADLGIEKTTLPKGFKLGSKPLVPPELILAIKYQDAQARELLKDLSVPWRVGAARFVLLKNIVEFNNKYDVIAAEYMRLANDLVDNLSKYKLEIRQLYVEAANEAFERLSKLASFTTPKDQFINEFLECIDKRYPKAEELRMKFSIRYDITHESIPDIAELSVSDILEESAEIRLVLDAQKKRATAEMEKYAETQVKYVRGIADKVITETIAFLGDGKKFTEKTMKKISEMIEQFRKINVAGDVILEDALVSFKTKFLDNYTSEKIRTTKSIQKDMLEDLATIKKIVVDAEQVRALSDAYRNKINTLK